MRKQIGMFFYLRLAKALKTYLKTLYINWLQRFSLACFYFSCQRWSWWCTWVGLCVRVVHLNIRMLLCAPAFRRYWNKITAIKLLRGKGFPVHAMKAYRWSRGTTPFIPNFGQIHAPPPLTPWKKHIGYEAGWVSGLVWRLWRQNLLPLPRMEPRIVHAVVYSLRPPYC